MAITTSSFNNPLVYKVTVNTDLDTGTANAGYANVTGTTGSIYSISIDNSANSHTTYVKFYDATSITVGTTAPVFIFRAAATVRLNVIIPDPLAFSSGISMAATNNEPGTAGTTDPGSAVVVRIVTT